MKKRKAIGFGYKFAAWIEVSDLTGRFLCCCKMPDRDRVVVTVWQNRDRAEVGLQEIKDKWKDVNWVVNNWSAALKLLTDDDDEIIAVANLQGDVAVINMQRSRCVVKMREIDADCVSENLAPLFGV